jgi:hypothetical protein
LTLHSPVPADFGQLLDVLREDAREAARDAAQKPARTRKSVRTR